LKIFGIQFGKTVIKDKVPKIASVAPSVMKPAVMRSVLDPTIKYKSMRSLGRGAFSPSEYDLAEIGRVEDTDSYVGQSMNKKVALMFKEGWNITGANPKSITYIKTRLAQIEQASKLSTAELLRGMGSSLVRKHNVFIVKVRDIKASGGKVRKQKGIAGSIKPVAGYFLAPAESMEYKLKGDKIVQWRHKMPDGSYKDFSPADIVHLVYNKKDGFIFGTPITVPVMDDIRALRKIEENIELLVYQHLFPLFQYKVGTKEIPATVTETGEHEVDIVRREIQFMPTEGGIVTPERHEITAIGAEGRALRAEGYLTHFKKRVFSGLGVSAVDFGEGETANRATADNMSRNLVDAVKDYQQVFEGFFNFFIINELLLESTFGDSVLDSENICKLQFKEIDIDAQIKKDNHYADLFSKNTITFNEARTEMGREPIVIPTREDIDAETDTAEHFPEWNNTFWKLFEEPRLLIQALDEPWSPLAKAISRTATLSTSEADINASQKAHEEQAVQKAKEISAPPVTATRPSEPKRKDGYLSGVFSELTNDAIERVTRTGRLDKTWVNQLIHTQMDTAITELLTDQMVAFHSGYMVEVIDNTNFINSAITARAHFQERANHYVTKLANDIVISLNRKVDNTDPIQSIASDTRAVFKSLKYRTRFIEDVEVRKAYNLGRAIAHKDNGMLSISSKMTADSSCAICNSHTKNSVTTEYVTLDDIPPFHPSCECSLITK